MTKKLSVMFVTSRIIFMIFIMRRTSADGYNDCFKDIDRNDNRIRIGFLSRYKSSKVSAEWQSKLVKRCKSSASFYTLKLCKECLLTRNLARHNLQPSWDAFLHINDRIVLFWWRRWISLLNFQVRDRVFPQKYLFERVKRIVGKDSSSFRKGFPPAELYRFSEFIQVTAQFWFEICNFIFSFLLLLSIDR